MKSTITLLAITVRAVFVLVGCNQNTPGNSTDNQSTNLPDMNTNMPATTN